MNIGDPMNDQTSTISDRVAVSRRQSLLQVMSPKSWRPMLPTQKQSFLKTSCPEELSSTENFGTDPYQVHERCVRSFLAIYMEDFRKVGFDVSYFQSPTHSEYDSAENIADSDLEDGELRKMLVQNREYLKNREDYEPSRMQIETGKPAALLQERGASAQSAQADLRKGLMCSSSQEPSAPVKLAALFSFGNEEPGDQFKSSVFRNADPSNVEDLSS